MNDSGCFSMMLTGVNDFMLLEKLPIFWRMQELHTISDIVFGSDRYAWFYLHTWRSAGILSNTTAVGVGLYQTPLPQLRFLRLPVFGFSCILSLLHSSKKTIDLKYSNTYIQEKFSYKTAYKYTCFVIHIFSDFPDANTHFTKPAVSPKTENRRSSSGLFSLALCCAQ